VAVASAGLYATLHLAPDRQPCQHPTTQFFTDRMPFLPPNQQRQSTEGTFALQQAATLHNLFDTISDSLISKKYKSRYKKTISLTKNWGCLEKTFTKIVKQ